MTPTAHAIERLDALPGATAVLAQGQPRVFVEGTLGLLLAATIALALLIGLATAGLAVSRYRNRRDPALRSLVVGLVLITVAPLPFRIFVVGTVPPVVRDAAPPIVQVAGLLAVLWAMYGDPRTSDGRLRDRVTRGDLLVVAVAVSLAATTVLVGELWRSGALVLVGLSFVVALSTFVAGQAARAAHRYRSPAMASLSVGIFFLAALPSPVGAALLVAGHVPEPVVVGVVSGAILLGETAMLLTLVYR
ncbi:hypothetical protein [Halorarum halobium]|uniref:hypothetical protein n=1 Tax=Halorarum halobium TaxID=3075121 RepID=UPI0028A99BF0|nr:hypothetical protein [Halobaculum sp. XH14]